MFGLDPVRDPVGVLGRIGYLSEDRDLPNWMRVDELLNFTQAYFPNWDPATQPSFVRHLTSIPRQRIKSLSRGQAAARSADGSPCTSPATAGAGRTVVWARCSRAAGHPRGYHPHGC
ncbi:MAG: hypothetical protein R3B91_11045 [Planctomycetaceae bacterium]